MKVKMLKESLGSPNGININRYKKGVTYDLPDKLAKVFIDQMKVAELDVPVKIHEEERVASEPTPPENEEVKEFKVEKKMDIVPKENKMVRAPKENKNIEDKPGRRWIRGSAGKGSIKK